MEGNNEVKEAAPAAADPLPPSGNGEAVDQPPAAPAKKQQKDWLAVGGIGIEKRRRSSNASYRIENNKVM
ncbi:hypothetical protein E2C01_089018 [Portunus trituberculatus]|uniref:Uncharacterized protein n=1 Tax=Portunus trituberculatus TaxID=210409 RepID=A0A5B7JHL7_PORTR|nr:hypothetical protein [Portunus trituberculatus]